MPLEDERLCGCCGCQVSWLDVTLRSPGDPSPGDGFGDDPFAMAASSTRSAEVYDVGAVTLPFSATVPSNATLLAAGLPPDFSATAVAFGHEASVVTSLNPYFDGPSTTAGPVFTLGGLPVLQLSYSVPDPEAQYYAAEWLLSDNTSAELQEAWDAAGSVVYGGMSNTVAGNLSAGTSFGMVSKSWIATSTLSVGGGTRYFDSTAAVSRLDCQAWRYQPDGDTTGLVTVSTSVVSVPPLGSDPVPSLSRGGNNAAVSHWQWQGLNVSPVIGSSGVGYLRFRLRQNGRAKAGKTFSIRLTRSFVSTVTATVTLSATDGYRWSNSNQLPSGVAWDGSSPLAASGVTINAASDYAVLAFTGQPGASVNVELIYGTATADDIGEGSFFAPSSWVISTYTRFAPAIVGGLVSIYRDGSLAYQGDANPPEGGPVFSPVSELATHGTYYMVSEKNAGFQEYRKEFVSFVVDTESPLVGCTAPNDIFAGETLAVPTVFATEPFASLPSTYRFYNVAGQSGGASRRAVPSAVGTYRVLPAQQSSGEGEAFFTDRAGNVAPFVPEFDLKIVAVPADGHRGARPTLSTPAPFVRNPLRGRKQNERVWWVDLSFDRKVLRSSVQISQVRLWKTTLSAEDVPQTVAVQPTSLEEFGDTGTRWRIAIPDADQTERSFWLCEFVPDGVVTDDVQTVEVESFDKLHAESFYKILYVTADTGKKYSKSPAGYVEVQGSYPLDANGVEYDPEPCLLSARVTWLMAGEDERNPVDVSHYSQALGPRPTLTAEFNEEAYDGLCSLTAGDQGFGVAGLGTYFYGKTAFAPGVPHPTLPPADCSYFGVRTTIDPCPPATLGDCAVPRLTQKHSSLIACDGDITGWVITPPEIPADALNYDDETYGLVLPALGNQQYPQIATPLAVTLLGGPVQVGSSVGGVSVRQNEWRAWLESEQEAEPQGWGSGVQIGGYSPVTFKLGGGYDTQALAILVTAHWVKASVTAARQCRTYPGLETSVLSPLTLFAQVVVFATETITYDEIRNDDGDLLSGPLERVRKLVLTAANLFVTLTKEQEEAIDNGEPIPFASDSGWTIAAT